MATRVDRQMVEASQRHDAKEQSECTLGEAALTVLGLVSFIAIPAIIGLVALKIVSWILQSAGFDVLTF
jgi:hypothetical protein